MSPKNTIRTPYHASRAVPVVLDATSHAPASLDEATRSVEVIASTQIEAMVYDWERWDVVREVLLMSGCRMPASGQLVLLDSHSRDSVTKVLGSFRSMLIKDTEHGPALVGRAHYSTAPESESVFLKVKEGHITDVSIGYEVLAHVWIKDGESTIIEGTTYTGPMRVALEWAPKELSICPIGADANAKFRETPAPPKSAPQKPAPSKNAKGRAKNHKEKNTMRHFLARLRKSLGLATKADLELLNEEGQEVTVEELTNEELVELVEEAEEIIAAADAAAAAVADDDENSETPQESDVPEAGSRGAGNRAAAVAGRQLSTRQAQQLERARVLSIQNLCRAHSVPAEMEENLLKRGTTLTAAKAKILDLRHNAAPSGPGFHVESGRTEGEKVRSAMGDAILMRCGVSVEKPAAGADTLRSYSLREMAREMLARSGGDVGGSASQMVGRALATTDLPMLLVESTRRVLMDAYEATPETWSIWAQKGSASDFKKSTAVGIEGDVKPIKKPEGAEYTEGRMAETAEEYFVETYGRKMKITREAIINDDLNALTALPRMYGTQAAELVGDVAYAALLSNAVMGDKKALFHADHKNLQTGAGGIPTVTNLGKLVTAMKLQKDSLGRSVNVMPKFFLGSVALEVAAEQFFNTQMQGGPIVSTQANPIAHNPYGGNFFTRVYDRRLDDTGKPNDYYVLANNGTVTVFFLGGVETPYIEDDIEFSSDAIVSKVRLDVGAKAMRWVTVQKATTT